MINQNGAKIQKKNQDTSTVYNTDQTQHNTKQTPTTLFRVCFRSPMADQELIQSGHRKQTPISEADP